MKRTIRECDFCGQEENQAVNVFSVFGKDICNKCFPEHLWKEYFDIKEQIHNLAEKFFEEIKARKWEANTMK